MFPISGKCQKFHHAWGRRLSRTEQVTAPNINDLEESEAIEIECAIPKVVGQLHSALGKHLFQMMGNEDNQKTFGLSATQETSFFFCRAAKIP